jgi:O-antigen/teichoic acid export membrane protein
VATIRGNILANILGGVWAAILSLLIIPFQVKILGMEAFGLVGLITTLQVIFGVLDLGLSATITFTVATDASDHHEDSRKLIQTASTLYWSVALVLGFVLCW